VFCVSAIQGALIQARVERSGAPIQAAADELARMLEARPAADTRMQAAALDARIYRSSTIATLLTPLQAS
jgi:hypothetical protein